MSEPKFQVGQLVAAMNSSLSFVVPCAQITRFKWRAQGPLRVRTDKVSEMPAGWYYTLSTHRRSPLDGRKLYWVYEGLLRPIADDEYTATPSKQEAERTA